MHIVQIVEPGVDGVFRHVEGLVKYLRRAGHVVTLVYSSRRGSEELIALVDELRRDGMTTIDLRISNAPEPGDLAALARIRCLATSASPDIIHAHSSKAGALARALPLLGGRVPVVYTPHAYFGLGQPGGLRAAVFNGIESALGDYGSTVHVSDSESTFADGALGLARSNRTTVNNGIDCGRFRPAAAGEVERARAKWGIPAAARVVGTVGRYSRQKDPLTLYQAIREVLAADERCWFLHVGRGEHFDAVTELIADWPERRRIVRIAALADTAEAYRAMSVHVLASRYEGLALSALEALATGLPLALTRCIGNTDFARFGLDALQWATPGRPREMAVAIHAALAVAPATNHRVVALAYFSEVAAFRRIESLYKRLVAGAPI